MSSLRISHSCKSTIPIDFPEQIYHSFTEPNSYNIYGVNKKFISLFGYALDVVKYIT